jgi:predicted SAM-dependent methyltransferase
MSLVNRLRNSYKVQQICATILRIAIPFIVASRHLTLRAKIAKRSELHIHFGCGEINDERFINVDARPLPHIDLITKSPLLRAFPINCAHSIYGCHVFEHIPYAQQLPVLRRWLSILRPGGKLMLSVPDFDKLVDRYLATKRDVDRIQEPLMGGQDYAGNFHFAILNRTHLTTLMERSGFERIAEWHPQQELAWPRDYSWDDSVSLNLVGYKSSA